MIYPIGRRAVLGAFASTMLAPLTAPHSALAAVPAVFPGREWEQVDIGARGWSAAKLDEAREAALAMPTGSTFIAQGGRVVARWGDDARPVRLSSVRKSLLSALFGIHVREGRIDLDSTLAQIGIDEDPPLSEIERTATVRMLLQARSGIYRPYVGGTPADRARMPAPGSHPPGSFWYYNNWDFNALGTIFERLSGTSIGAGFLARIAAPIGMQDLRMEDITTFAGSGLPVERSVHPIYHFNMSARDAARFGHLYLRGGMWGEPEVVPAEWVRESTTAYSSVGQNGYGYLWWIDAWPGVTVRTFSARGALGKYIIVVPERDLVVVYLNHTAFPSNAAAMSAEELARLPSANRAQVGKLLSAILAAQPG